MHAGDNLHHAPVAVSQPQAVDILHKAMIGTAIPSHGYVVLPRQHAGHAGRPQQLILQVFLYIEVQALQAVQRFGELLERWCDKFQQRLGIVGGDIWMRQGRTQRPGVRCKGDSPGIGYPQAFFLQPEQTADQQPGISPVADPGKRVLHRWGTRRH